MMKTFLLFCVLALPAVAQKWTIQYFFDQMKEEMEITDLAFPSADRGIAVGAIYDKASGKEKYIAVTTSDGGAHWSLQPIKEYPRSIYFLNDSTGWMVTDKGVWFTEESGRSWKKLCEQLKPDKNLEPETTIGLLLRVWFLDEKHGFGVGLQKTIVESNDGGRTWNPVAAAAEPAGNPAYTAFTHIMFADAKRGVIVGGSQPPRNDGYRGSIPAWMDPERAAKRKQVPTLTLLMQTSDGGATWNSSTVPVFGLVSSVRFSGGDGLMVMGFNDSFQWPSEVYRLADTNSGRVFREKTPRVIDAQLYKGPHVFLAGVEPTGKMNTAAIPGKVKILESTDFSMWTEMPVDYKAVARSVVMAGPDPEHLWVATDTGMILHLKPKP
jgi:photosynthesis system II assembly factor YCF48-like protein